MMRAWPVGEGERWKEGASFILVRSKESWRKGLLTGKVEMVLVRARQPCSSLACPSPGNCKYWSRADGLTGSKSARERCGRLEGKEERGRRLAHLHARLACLNICAACRCLADHLNRRCSHKLVLFVQTHLLARLGLRASAPVGCGMECARHKATSSTRNTSTS
jgi:hypothetical protein